MSAKISILVKDESLFSKAMTIMWFVNIFRKSKLNVTIDGSTQELVASKTPYEFDVQAGTHTIHVEDPKGKGKRGMQKVSGAFVGGAIGLAMGSGLSGAMTGASMVGNEAVNMQSELYNVGEGETLKLQCRANGKGDVKVKVLK